MSIPLAGYGRSRLLRSTAHTRVYELEREDGGGKVVAKVFRADDPRTEARVRHEFRLLESLDVEGVIKALAIERLGDNLVLVLESIESRDLRQFAAGQALSVREFLAIARPLAAILAQVHDRGIVHRDIKPSNILIERGTDAVYLADFGISVLLDDERRRLNEPDVLVGTLPYLSPEQTGRTKRSVDFRSDLYSLGVTFYELLSGRRPFDGLSPLELVHAHLARRPAPPAAIRPQLPERLSAIVMKLLDKAPEYRYQSARGLLADLDRLDAALAAGEADPRFELGERDHATTLQFPRQLYGRAAELATLSHALTAVAEGRRRRVVSIEARAGLGKTALARSLDAPLAAVHGELIGGRFVAEDSPRPYAGLVDALASFVEHILTEDEASLGRWRKRLETALGPLTPVVASLVPGLEHILDASAAAAPLEPAQARNRLRLAFGRLLSAFAANAPLVLILDDLHHAERESLDLLFDLVQQPGPAILFVLAHQGDADGQGEAIGAGLDALASAGVPVERLALAPLSDEALTEMLADVLGCAADVLGALALLVGRKTNNNPQLVRQFLVHLASEQLLVAKATGWAWDMDAIAEASIPDDVLGMLAARVERLPERARWLLCCAAHIGARFDVSLLALLAELDDDALSADLRALEAEGLIDLAAHGYRFAHEQLRTLALEVAEPGRSAELAARLARELLARHGHGSLGERLFEVVEHLRAAEAGGQLDGEERLILAELAVEAGQRALDNAAWASARPYFEEAAALLAGRARPELEFAAHFGHAQCLALTGQALAADAAFEALLGRELSPLDHGRVVARRVSILMQLQRPAEAIEVGLGGLRQHGVELPAKCSLARLVFWVVRAWRQVHDRSREQWLARPQLDDPDKRAASLIIEALKSAAYLEDKNLFVVLSSVHVHLGASAQLDPLGPVALSQLAIAGAAALRKPAEAATLCEHAIALCEQPFVGEVLPQVKSAAILFVWPLARPWSSFNETVVPLVEELTEAGDLDLGGWSMVAGLAQLFCWDRHLANVVERGRVWAAELDRWGSEEQRLGVARYFRLARLLTGDLEQIDELVSREESVEIDASALSLTADVSARMCARVLLGQLDGAYAELLTVVDDYEEALFGTWQVAMFAMWAAIVEAHRWETEQPSSERRPILRRMRRYLATARTHVAGSPDNFSALFEIVTAERERVRGRPERAIAAYRRASDHASRHAALLLEGVANLRLAELAARLGHRAEVQGAHTLAARAMRRWGAKAVTSALESARATTELGHEDFELTTMGSLSGSTSFASSTPLEHSVSGLGGSSLGGSGSSAGASSGQLSHTSGGPAVLDLATVVQTMNLISEDLRLDEVVGRVLDEAVTSAGADRGVLLLEREHGVGVIAHREGERTQTELEPIPLAEMAAQLPMTVINYVLRTGTPVILDDASSEPRFAGDSYISGQAVRSLLCMPIVKHERRVGALVLENRLTSHGFPSERLELLRLLVAQAASALDNAQLFDALQRSEARWRSLVAGAPDTILVMDARGRVELINHMSARPEVQSMVGELAEQLFDAEAQARWREALAAVRGGEALRELELELCDGAGERRWFVARVAPVDASSGRVLAILTDISDRKQLEATVRQQQRLESIGTLAAGVAHEINNPIQGILSYAELIGDEAGGDETIAGFSAEITAECERVTHIVRDLLTFSRQEVVRADELVAPSEFVESTLTLVRALMRKDGVHVDVDVPTSLPRLRCRPQQIRQIIMNLVANARDALNERYGSSDPDKRISIRAVELARGGRRWVRFDVEDRGGGIPEALEARIFDPFFTTKGNDRGTGLGLSVSHGIAVEHGGELTVDSEPGVGTTFHLLLPVDPAVAAAQARAPANGSPAPRAAEG